MEWRGLDWTGRSTTTPLGKCSLASPGVSWRSTRMADEKMLYFPGKPASP